MDVKNILNHLASYFPDNKILSVRPASGGCINTTFVIELSDKKNIFVKSNKKTFEDIFIKEKFNLEHLKNKSSLKIPDVILFSKSDENVYLCLEYIEKSAENNDFHFLLGRGLAELHKNTEKFFGWYHDNYIGSLKQKNTACNTWTEFFVTQRLEPLVKECFDKTMLTKKDLHAFENLYASLDNIFPSEPPALLHGDLWTGNRMNSTQGAAIFDPACYFGHREMDIAMLNLFDRTNEMFEEGYNSIYPLEKKFKERLDICNLYPLLVHAILFGYNYIFDIKTIIRKFQ